MFWIAMTVIFAWGGVWYFWNRVHDDIIFLIWVGLLISSSMSIALILSGRTAYIRLESMRENAVQIIKNPNIPKQEKEKIIRNYNSLLRVYKTSSKNWIRIIFYDGLFVPKDVLKLQPLKGG